jgi:hypothetical protein
MWTKDSSFELDLPSVVLSEAIERRRAPRATQTRKGNSHRRAVALGGAGSCPCANRVALIHITHAACARPAGIPATAA